MIVQQHILEPVGKALEYYSVMEKASRDEEATTKP